MTVVLQVPPDQIGLLDIVLGYNYTGTHTRIVQQRPQRRQDDDNSLTSSQHRVPNFVS
ncbi:hypothetical protein [Nocardioides sp. SYSU D00065]|uniref:hypothetical protein n=1 Tax=Nocardioides sp. SYSU D00065 TaxID=2817378 RepID=UPI001B3393A0|nr:hypothetical protein [Nocardioides sp. SYSU D00065]